jgi:hypothetical protein
MDFDTPSSDDESERLLLILFFYSQETCHRTIATEIENDSTFAKLDAYASCDCVQLER